jgi:hypothetical protein
MSRVEVTDLVPGELALSADVNATLASWNTNAAAGMIGAANVRMEGIDRRTMSADAHVVYTVASGTYTEAILPTGPLTNITGIYAVVPLLITDSLSFSVNTQIIVHATLYFESAASAVSQQVAFKMQFSVDGGGTWTDIPGTRQRFSLRDTQPLADPLTPFPGIATSASWSVYTAAAATQVVLFRIGYLTANAVIPFEVLSGTIFTETFTF